MDQINVISDVAGQFAALERLTAKMPPAPFLSLGDMVDRGPDSDKVLEFFRRPGNSALMGNHEHLMLDWHGDNSYYRDRDLWLYNGGDATLQSFNRNSKEVWNPWKLPNWRAPADVLAWVQGLQKHLIWTAADGQQILISHAFVPPKMSLQESLDLGPDIFTRQELSILWSRYKPIERPEFKLQICGHNSHWGLTEFKTETDQLFALCLDDSRKKKLTGIHLPSLQIFQEDF